MTTLLMICINRCAGAYLLSAEQKVSKYKETAKNTIHVHAALLRLPEQETDILVTFNDPVNIK